jgi:hypothetical protein
MSPTTVGELKQVLVEEWELIHQLTVDKLCCGFGDQRRLCWSAMESWTILTSVDRPWLAYEDEEFYPMVRTIGHRRKVFEKQGRLPGRICCQMKNRWFTVLRKREAMYTQDTDQFLGFRSLARSGGPIPEIRVGNGT